MRVQFAPDGGDASRSPGRRVFPAPAGTLALSQSATSTALGELERLYDTQLFDRVGKNLRLQRTGAVPVATGR